MIEAPSIPVYFEAAGAVIALILFGKMLEARAKKQTGPAVEPLMGLQSKTARIIKDEVESEIETAAVVPGD